jgi:hypothetical protein
MRHAVLAAALAFRTPITVGSPVPPVAQRVADVILAWLDRRRARIDASVQ